MSVLLTVIAFVVALSVLIVVHEYGHYKVARLFDVKVICFSVGFGRSVWSRKIGADGTEWRLAAIPLGGYVKMLDEREGDVSPAERHRAFNQQTVWRRFAIVAAGPAANFVAALFLYWVLFLHGVPGTLPVVGAPVADSPAARAGFASGEVIVKLEGQEVRSWQDFRWMMLQIALDRKKVAIEVKNEQNAVLRRELDMSRVSPQDIEGDILGALGFSRLRIPVNAVIGDVVAGGAASRAGLQAGDLVVSIEGERITEWDALVRAVRAAPEGELRFQVRRGAVDLPVIIVKPDRIKQNGSNFGRIGASPKLDPQIMQKLSVTVAYGPVESLAKAAVKTWDTAIFSLRMLGKMLTGDLSLKNLSGPITIADYAGQSAQGGWIAYLLFLALISISLGVLNLLPIPLLDGGHLMYYSVEIITGRPVSDRVMEAGQHLGMVVLFVLMAFAMFNDINRIFGN